MTVFPGTDRAVARGEVLLEEGKTTGQMYVVRSGTLEILRYGDDGAEFQLGQVGPGRMLGEIAMLCDAPHSATVRALEDSVVSAISRDELDKLVAERKTPLEDLLHDLSKNLVATVLRSSDQHVATLERELALTRLRATMGTMVVHLLLAFSAYALLMKWLTARPGGQDLAVALSMPVTIAMALVGLSFMRSSGVSAAYMGMGLADAGRSAIEGVVATLPVAALLIAVKWLLVTTVPAFSHLYVFQGLHDPLTAVVVVNYAAYVFLIPLQELMARGFVQGPLFDMFVGTPSSRTFRAIVVGNVLFGITHLHLSITYGVAAFLVGLLWGGLYAYRRSLAGPTVSHVIVGVFGLHTLGYADLLKSLP